VAAEVNSDGKPDLICANQIANTLTVMTNNGAGVFGFNATLGVGRSPACVVVADVNGDGKPDVICANAGDSTLMVLTNNGSGIFGSNAKLNVGSWLQWVTAVDVNGDGKLDLVTANYNDNTLTVLTNNGSGIFGSNATLNVGSRPCYVAAADVNGDGKVDLISVNFGAHSLTVLTNNGSGIFGSNATLTVGNWPLCVTATDINGDGKVDLVSANAGQAPPNYGNTLTVLTNNGSGIFGSNATLTVGAGPTCVVATDVNGDGIMDLVCTDYGSNSLTVLTQTIVGPPVLAIASVGPNQIALSWSSFSTGFALQTNSDITTTNWRPAGYTISTTNGTNESTTVTLPAGKLFFRLIQ
jgi:hypothetical protein